MSDRTFTLADSFDEGSRLKVDLSAPLPLGYAGAIRRALELREMGGQWSYPVIADVMREYHGIARCAYWWAQQLRLAGAAPRPRGTQITEQAFERQVRDAA